MSNATYSKCWLEANELLKELSAYETPQDPNLQIKDRASAFPHYAVLYIKYISLYKKLQIAHDQLLHPQKRRLLKEMLIASIGRLVEVKHILVDLECSDFFNLSEILLDLKLTHEALEIPVPRFIGEEISPEQEAIKKLLDTLDLKEFKAGGNNVFLPAVAVEVKSIDLPISVEAIKPTDLEGASLHHEEQDVPQKTAVSADELEKAAVEESAVLGINTNPTDTVVIPENQMTTSLDMATNLISPLETETVPEQQTAASIDTTVMLQRQETTAAPSTTPDPSPEILQKAAIVIQKLYRGHLARNLVSNLLHDQLVFLGMSTPNIKPPKNPNNNPYRKLLQKQYESDYITSLLTTKDRIFKAEEQDIKQSFKDEFRQWYIEHKKRSGKFPEFPIDEEWQRQDFKFGVVRKQSRGEVSVKATKPVPPKKGEDANNKFKELGESEFIKMGLNQIQQFELVWKDKDESNNFSQRHDQEVIAIDKRREVVVEIKQELFQILKQELQDLKETVERDSVKKVKVPKAKKPKDENMAKKSKKDKDLFSESTMESIAQELAQKGIIQKYSPSLFDSWLGTLTNVIPRNI
jgi:IQ and AAA domain-containing protein